MKENSNIFVKIQSTPKPSLKNNILGVQRLSNFYIFFVHGVKITCNGYEVSYYKNVVILEFCSQY